MLEKLFDQALGFQSKSPPTIGLDVEHVGVILGQIEGCRTLRRAFRSRELTDAFALHGPHRQDEWKDTIVLPCYRKRAGRQRNRRGDRRTAARERALRCSCCRTERWWEGLCDRNLPGVLCNGVEFVGARRWDVKELPPTDGRIGARQQAEVIILLVQEEDGEVGGFPVVHIEDDRSRLQREKTGLGCTAATQHE